MFPLAHWIRDCRFILVTAETESQRLWRLSAVGTVLDLPPSSKQLRGHEGRGSPDPPFAHAEAGGWAAPPVTVSNPGSCLVNSLSQRIASVRCIPTELPREPASGPPAHTGWHQVGQSMLPNWGTCYSHRGPGLWKCHPPHLPAPDRGQAPPEYPGTWALPDSLLLLHTPARSLSAPPFPGPQTKQGWFCPFPRGENQGPDKDKRRSKVAQEQPALGVSRPVGL